MRTARPTSWTVLLASLLAAGLSSCAGAQKPAGAEAGSGAEGAATAAVPGAVAGGQPPGPAGGRPSRPTASAEVEKRARAQFAHGVQLQALGDLDGAAAIFDEVRRSGAELPWSGLNAGLIEERRGHPERAVQAYQRTIEDFPGFAPAAQNLVRLWRRQGRPLPELEQELRGRLASADGVALRVGLAEVLLARSQYAAAEEECKKALKADEKNVPAMTALASSYAARKHFELARTVLENARQIDPGDPAVWNRLGFVELALDHRPQAIEHFRTAASLRPDYPEAHANYGAVLAEADDFATAAPELELAARYAPDSAGTWLNLGNARRGLQESVKAEAAYQKALQLDPSLNDARFNLAVLYLDVPRPGLTTLQRLEQGLGWLDEFEQHGGREPRVAGYRKDATREIDREKKRLAREEKDRLRQEAEARQRAEEEARRPAAAPPPARSDAPGAKPKEGGDR